MPFLTWYWQTFGVDLLSPAFWLCFLAVEAIASTAGALAGYRFGLLHPVTLAIYGACSLAGLAINLAF